MTSPVCPLCENKASRVLVSAESYCVRRCARCQGMFRDPYPRAVFDKCDECGDKCLQPEQCFDRSFQESFLSLKVTIEQRRWDRIKERTGINAPQAKVLELGTGAGALAALMLADGVDYRGLEGSRIFYEQCLRSYPALKGRIVQSFDPDGHFQQETFDLIVLNDILQFVPYPLNFLRRVSKRLKPGGLLYLEVPNESAFKLRARVRNILGLYAAAPAHPGHINFFTRATLEKLLNQAGCPVRQMAQISLAADTTRLKMSVKKKPSALLLVGSHILSLTKLDLALQLGNYVTVAVQGPECGCSAEEESVCITK